MSESINLLIFNGCIFTIQPRIYSSLGQKLNERFLEITKMQINDKSEHNTMARKEHILVHRKSFD